MIKKIVMRWLYQTDTGGFLQTDFQFSGHIFIDLEEAAGAHLARTQLTRIF